MRVVQRLKDIATASCLPAPPPPPQGLWLMVTFQVIPGIDGTWPDGIRPWAILWCTEGPVLWILISNLTLHVQGRTSFESNFIAISLCNGEVLSFLSHRPRRVFTKHIIICTTLNPTLFIQSNWLQPTSQIEYNQSPKTAITEKLSSYCGHYY